MTMSIVDHRSHAGDSVFFYEIFSYEKQKTKEKILILVIVIIQSLKLLCCEWNSIANSKRNGSQKYHHLSFKWFYFSSIKWNFIEWMNESNFFFHLIHIFIYFFFLTIHIDHQCYQWIWTNYQWKKKTNQNLFRIIIFLSE